MKFFTIVKKKSERIKEKNFQNITYDIPLWKWTVENLISDDNKIYINTDSKILLNEILKNPNMIGIERSKEHIEWEEKSHNSGSPVESMFKDFCENYTDNKNEKVCLFHVTSPFVSLETIKKASCFLDKGFDSVQSVKKIKDFLFFLEDYDVLPINYDPKLVQRTQDLKPVYMSLGAFFISRAKDVIKTGRRLPGKCFNYELNSLEAIEIDNYDQLDLARLIAENINRA
tara:strand:+ start:2290 stop:2976 length:687 start_codon:yes stop_codon:yes gene_type:complete